jgi:hypothetical protein
MGRIWKKVTEKLSGRDAHGKVYEIHEITEYEDFGGIGTDKMESAEHRKYLQTTDGIPVDKIDDDTFNVCSIDSKTGKFGITVRKIKQ